MSGNNAKCYKMRSVVESDKQDNYFKNVIWRCIEIFIIIGICPLDSIKDVYLRKVFLITKTNILHEICEIYRLIS
jgi:hypothetical protein